MTRVPPRRSLAVVLLTLLAPSVVGAAEPAYAFADARRFVTEFCVECHGTKKAQGKLNLQRFETQAQLVAERKVWDEVIVRVRNGEMPPKSKKAVPPPEEARQAFVRWVETMLRQVACDDRPKPGPAPVRRLNKSQYRTTIRDLLGIHIDAARDLPDDGAGGEGFDNAAETLFLSPVHAEKYLDAAKRALGYVERDSEARKLLFIATPDEKTKPEEAARRVLERFGTRAFRRPIREGEADRLMQLFRKEQERGQPFDESLLYAMRAVLISPHFLFRVEEPATAERPTPLSDHELATRLSYFLYNSMPDAELFRVAGEGKLHDPKVLRQQMTRMLKDRTRGRGLPENFVGQWLETRRLGADIKPDRKVFPRYTDELENAMCEEPVRFLQEILAEDRSLIELIDADYTYADRALAGLYGIPPKERSFGQLDRLTLPKDSHRGGVLTMAGVLTVSSHAHRTSPVLRGKWVLETLLGSPPPPPPPDVPQLPEGDKAPAGKTLRERLVAHRANPSCASCHDRIDPIGFGLENFDAIGRWRTKDADQPIDASGALPDGTKFNGPDELKKALLAHKDEFVRHFAAKLLGYALGRGLVNEDYCVVDRAVAQARQNDYRAHALIWEILDSAPFRLRPGRPNKRGTP
jgi:hypothetical protein